MSNFFVALWESIFQPGTTPQLIIATHVSFIALLSTLAWLIYATSGNLHFYALFTIALLLWLAIIWFIQELKNVDLKDNQQMSVSTEKQGEADPSAKDTISRAPKSSSSSLRSRKV